MSTHLSFLKNPALNDYYIPMRKPVLPRIIFLLVLYFVIFTALVSVQFAKQRGFTKRIGSFVVSGQYRMPGEEEEPPLPNEYFLEGNLHIVFGGIDFCLVMANDGHSLYLAGEDGAREAVLPDRLTINDDTILLSFPGGTALEFTQNTGGTPEMRINGFFAEDVTGIELPFKLQRSTGIRDAGDGRLIFRSSGVNYTFGLSRIDTDMRILLIEAGGRPVSYRAITDNKALSLEDFILSEAATGEAYDEAVRQWRDRNYSLWNRAVSSGNNEDVVVSLLGEALARGTYSTAVASVPQAFLAGTTRTYESSVYLGALDQAYRLLSTNEREKSSRISGQLNEKSLAFLLEPRVLNYFAVRGNQNLINSTADLVNTIDPTILAMDIVPGIFEGYRDWMDLRPGTENPFERLVDEALQLIFESLRKSDDGSRVFLSEDNLEDTEFNLRLGKALLIYAENAGDITWAGIGRSLVLSALYNGSVLDAFTAKLYRLFKPLDTYPRAIAINATGTWAWTTAETIGAVQQTDELDISVNFPAGETHYMIIRGIRQFSRIQLYGMDFRTDPQFERYDSSGWSYVAQEQTLLVKMKHRENVEHIRIIFREAPRPAPPPEPVNDENAGNTPGAVIAPVAIEGNFDS